MILFTLPRRRQTHPARPTDNSLGVGRRRQQRCRFIGSDPDTEGKLKIWRAIRATAKVSSSDVKAWGNNLAFGNEIVCGNPRTRINGLAVYGEPLIPWVLKEDSIGSIQNGIYAEIPIGEMRSVRSELNGRAWLPYGVYLYFSLLDGVEKFYENRLDDCGPNRDEGFPSDRKGEITHMISFPGRIFAAIDAGEGGVSSIQCYNQIGWHEIYRSSSTGLRITRMFVQVIPGASARLWFSEGEEINWLPISLNPQTQNDHKYHASGELITAWVYGGYKEIKKFLKHNLVHRTWSTSIRPSTCITARTTRTPAGHWQARSMLRLSRNSTCPPIWT